MSAHRITNRLSLGLSLGMTALIAVPGLSGCAGILDPQAGQDRYPILDSPSAFNTEKTDWRTPLLEGFSNPFATGQQNTTQPGGRTHNTANATAGSNTSVAVANPPGSAVTAARTRGTTPTAAAPSGATATTPLRPQIGIYLDGADRDSRAAYQLVRALDTYAPEYGMTVLKPGALMDALGDASTCSEPTSARCRQTLAIYPGVRALIIVDIQPGGSGDQARVTTRMADTDFGVDYDPARVTVALQDNDLALWSRQVLDRTAERLAIAPWFTHSFARQGDSVYISAGPRSGLETGTTLAMHGEGQIVRAPGGGVVGWSPGPVVGRLKVKNPVGQRASLAELISGQLPTPGDRLTVVEQQDLEK